MMILLGIKRKIYFIIFVLSVFLYCNKSGFSPKTYGTSFKNAKQLTILYTNDEHGWMESGEHGGAAGMFGLWRSDVSNTEKGPFLVLSGGDNWSGPAISTWFQGESMVEVMNAMGYDAAAIGNHEFDFNIEGLMTGIDQAEFTYLAANIREKNTGERPKFATPYLMTEINDIHIGVVGLASVLTPLTTFPDHVANYEFIPYEEALDKTVPELRKRGTELVIVLGHITGKEMRELAPKAKELKIPLIFGGHSHLRINETIEGVRLIIAGSHMEHYAKLEILFDINADTVVSLSAAIEENRGGIPDNTVAAIVAKWHERTEAELAKTIGYVNETIDRHSVALANLITDSWLIAVPTGNVALTNRGGIRQSISSGEITLATIVGVLPFENRLVQLDLTGNQLLDCVRDLEMGGITSVGGYRLFDGTNFHADSIYQVVTTDYLYSRDDYPFSNHDPTPYNTGIHFRQPVIDWIESLNTDETRPLDMHLDLIPRK